MGDTTTRSGWTRHIPLAVVAVVATVGYFTLRDYLTFDTLRDNRAVLIAFRDQHLIQMAAAFIGIYVVIVTFSLPGAAVASVTGGFLFGLLPGVLLNMSSATIGATLIFLAARWGPGAVLTARLETSEGKLRRLKEGLRANEVSVLLLLRLLPVVPFFVANLLPALVGVKFFNFVWTTAVGIIPGTIAFTWIGVGLGAAFDRGAPPDLSLLWQPYVIGPILALCALPALPLIIRAIRGKKEV